MFQFLLPALDCFLIQSGDLRKQTNAAMAYPVGFHRYIPTALLLIQAAQQQVHLRVELLVGMIFWLLAVWALTHVND